MDRYDAFTVRVWRRAGADGEQWAGRLEYLQGQDGWRFGDADALLAYLRDLIGPRRELAGGEAPLALPASGRDTSL